MVEEKENNRIIGKKKKRVGGGMGHVGVGRRQGVVRSQVTRASRTCSRQTGKRAFSVRSGPPCRVLFSIFILLFYLFF